ncbi:Putative L-lactate dehydrogenase operon regulatory protein [Pseudooceanicola marinus]|uniref:Putative L-lactate dehydrogenase operon regulatory protein n=1 Tax=Pseudooceanicola marinus TaxID=396013 RepID=A0A1X6Y5L3_9RHOB|nr:FCD domain-containing protein [Pseudooceanicola marinus]SLN10655.1 Putative L-lactate dehydrogenase operon regulatory protein [Pseudooceanicola marinus]
MKGRRQVANGAERRSRPVQVAEAIKDYVVEEGLRMGDRLPGEAELIARFGMSKGTIREAMRILEAQGLVKTRTGPGGGSFVHEVSRERAQALLGNYFYFRDLTLKDIYQMRRWLEPELAASLAGKLTDAQLSRLDAVVETYDHPSSDVEEEREQHIASLRFHQLLAEFARNELLGFVIGFMAQILSDLTIYRRLYEPANPELWEKGRAYQLELLDALRRGDADRARLVMADHMATAEQLMEGQEAEMLKRFLTA